MTTPHLITDLMRDEGLRLRAYPDPLSLLAKQLALPPDGRSPGWESLSGAPYTIGYGHTGPEVHPDLVWTEQQARDALIDDIMAAKATLDAHIAWWRNLCPVRQDALCNMCFNMGWGDGKHGLSSFKNTLRRIEDGQYMNAASGLANSAWARQVGPRRSGRIIRQIRDGL